MAKNRFLRIPGVLLAAVLSAAFVAPAMALSPNPRELPAPPADAEGLAREPSARFDELHLRPGADLARYRRIRISAVDVTFPRLWQREHRDLDERDVRRLRAELTALAQEEVRRQFSRGGYSVADAPGAGVLDLSLTIANLDLRAPKVHDASIRRAYVLSAGEGTMIAELRDSQTGALLARVVDRREMRESATFQIANDITNSGDAQELVGLWSNTLRRYLDAAGANGKGS